MQNLLIPNRKNKKQTKKQTKKTNKKNKQNKKEEKMKKLLTFAGVSALALITAAPDAFAAATTDPRYGVYNPTCDELSGSITVRFWGLVPGSNGAAATIDELYTTTITDATAPAWGTTTTIAELKAQIANPTKVGAVTYANGLTPRGAVLYSVGQSSPAVTLYTANEGLLVTKTTDEWSPATMIGSDTIADNLVNTFSFGLGDGAAFPKITQTNVKTIKNKANDVVINYIIAYAANCIQPTGGECVLTIEGEGNGGAYYYNECDSGYVGTEFGDKNLLCSTASGAAKCGNISTQVKKVATQKSDTPEWVTAAAN